MSSDVVLKPGPEQEYAFIKRVGAEPIEGEVYAELEMRAGDTVARLAARACKEFKRWEVDADQLRLYLVPHKGKENPTRIQEEEAELLDKPAYSLEEARVANGAWLLARASPLAPPAAAGALPGGALASCRTAATGGALLPAATPPRSRSIASSLCICAGSTGTGAAGDLAAVLSGLAALKANVKAAVSLQGAARARAQPLPLARALARRRLP